jgi:uncharacterized protein with von Willebrand factor type A (vWA) domain
MRSPPVPDALLDDPPFVPTLVGFVHELRGAGLAAGSGDVLTYCSAMEPLDPTDLVDLYWGGRVTLVTRRDQIPDYDRVFHRYFLDEGADGDDPLKLALKAKSDAEPRSTLEIPDAEPREEGKGEEEVRLGLMASNVEVLRNKSFSACTPEELAALRRIMVRIRLTPPRRRTRRTMKARSGVRPDLRRTVRETLRTHGEPPEMFWRRRRRRLRPLILLLDVSGSMADYSRNLVQFAHSARRADARVEVFCFGTRLTRITKMLERRRPDEAMARAAQAVVDWEGGTRIGDSIAEFVRRWGRQGTGRGGIVVICSDGLDRGDPEVLAGAMERLARLSHRVVWMNPHMGNDTDFVPNTLGMMVAAPHVDTMLSGHDLRSLEQFAARLPEFG